MHSVCNGQRRIWLFDTLNHFDVRNKHTENRRTWVLAVQANFAMLIMMLAQNDAGLDVTHLGVKINFFRIMEKNKHTS